MARAPSGFLGKLAAQRPLLATMVLALGLTALCVVGLRQSAASGNAGLVISFISNALYVVGAPLVLAAITPRRMLNKSLFLVLTLIVAIALAAAAHQSLTLPFFHAPPPLVMTLSALGLFAFLTALAPFMRGVVRLGVLAPLAGILGAAGGAGYLALEGLLSLPTAAIAVALALTVGGTTGLNVAADFAKYFAKGATGQEAAAAACHGAIAPTVFAIFAVAALFVVETLNANFGAIEWNVLWGGVSVSLLAAAAALVAVTAGLALERVSEQVAVDENRRREWFGRAWRPIRRILPATTALAATAIAGVFVVIAAFEAGVNAPVNLILFFVIISVAAALAFVSLRTSLLIVAMLLASAQLADFVYAVFGAATPALSERLAAMTLTAIALSQLTVSWRNAGEVWRNARDIAQNAMADGLHRFLAATGLGAASLIAVAQSFAWEGGFAAAAYFVATGVISVILAPVMMIAMSAKTGGY